MGVGLFGNVEGQPAVYDFSIYAPSKELIFSSKVIVTKEKLINSGTTMFVRIPNIILEKGVKYKAYLISKVPGMSAYTYNDDRREITDRGVTMTIYDDQEPGYENPKKMGFLGGIYVEVYNKYLE